MKYTILNRIGLENWAPTNHASSITTWMAKLIFLMGTKAKLIFGEYIFYQTMKKVETFEYRLFVEPHVPDIFVCVGL